MTVIVRQMVQADLERAGLIAMAAYNRASSYEPMLRRYLALQPDGWYLALLNGTPVGLGGMVDFGTFAYLGMMSVLPAVQKRGIGQALMERLLARLDACNCPSILLNARPQAISLYERYGFVILEQTQQWRILASPQAWEMLPGVSLLTEAEIAEIAAFDEAAFGASRRAVLAHLFASDPRRFFVSRDVDKQLTGFLCAGETALGPWHAANADAARVLLQQARRLPGANAFKISVSEKNRAAQLLFESQGGEMAATLAHMHRGQSLQRDPEQRLYGMGSLMSG